MEETIVLFPSPGMQGHLAPTVELAKLILTHHPTFSITILVLNPPPNSDHQHPTSAFKNITFHRLSPISDHDTLPNLSSVEHFFDLPRLHNPNVRKILQSLSEQTKLRAFVIDFFCDAAFEVSAALNIPTYYFFTSGGGGLALLLYLRTIDSQTGKSIKDMEFPVSVPGLPLISPSDIPVTIQDRTTTIFK
ncbi:hypothetical protein TIFTF001_051506, partial [Ficus carica]